MRLLKKMLIAAALLTGHAAISQTQEDKANALRESLNWWQNAKFGIFVHWGLYSVAGGDWNGKPSKGNEHFMLYERIPVKEYAKIAGKFNPVKFDADEWVKSAKDAGMKYIVFTSKHHDGYAMYNSASSDYNIVKTTKSGRDPVRELAEACKKYGLKLGLYYSLGRDWEDPDVPTNWPVKAGRSNTWDFPDEDSKDFSKYFERKVKPQVRELLTQYGSIAVTWFDTPEMISKEQSAELRRLIKSLQPDCIINSRIGNGMGDYDVLEQKIASDKISKPWESCITMSGKWSYNRYDSAWKSPELMVRQLVQVAARGGNMLLNIAPNGEGAILPEAKERLVKIGKWMSINNESVCGTRPWIVANENQPVLKTTEAARKSDKGTMQDTDNDNTSKKIVSDVWYTAKGNNVYLFACSWKSPEIDARAFAGSKNRAGKVSLLGTSKSVKWKQDENGLHIIMPSGLPATVPVYVFKIRVKQ